MKLGGKKGVVSSHIASMDGLWGDIRPLKGRNNAELTDLFRTVSSR